MPQKILVVEDTRKVRTIVAFTLRNRGMEVMECSDGEEVLAMVRQHRPDLVILDVMLPNKDGFEILQELRADPVLKSTKVLMLTAVTEGTDKDDEYWKQKTGADEFLSKPFQIQELLQVVERLLVS